MQDEIDDGLAASAMEQAKIWAKAVQDEKTDFDKDFIAQLVNMVCASIRRSTRALLTIPRARSLTAAALPVLALSTRMQLDITTACSPQHAVCSLATKPRRRRSMIG